MTTKYGLGGPRDMEGINELKILTWNVNFGGDALVYPAPFLENYINDYDVIILTEVVFNKAVEGLFKKEEYDIILSQRLNQKYANQVVIATKKNLNVKAVVDKLCHNESDDEDNPNFLQVQITAANSTYNIIGVRILSTSKAEQFQQCKRLAEYINSNKLKHNTIIAGDFNCGAIRGDSNKSYQMVKEEYEYTRDGEPNELRFYNFHKIKELFDNFHLKETYGEQKTWRIDVYNGYINYGGAKIKNDLAIYSKNIDVTSEYSWDFVRDNQELYENMLICNKQKKGNEIDHGFPDHAILKITLKL